ncbi:MAG: hypothetical protein WEE89_21685 [Gemmatimonadota bacterium]
MATHEGSVRRSSWHACGVRPKLRHGLKLVWNQRVRRGFYLVELDHVTLTRDFLNRPDRFLRQL